MIIDFNTYKMCKNVYANLGQENARTALYIMKGLFKQGFQPKISALKKDIIEFSSTTGFSDITQKFDFAKRTLTQDTRWEQTINGQIRSGHRLDVLNF